MIEKDKNLVADARLERYSPSEQDRLPVLFSVDRVRELEILNHLTPLVWGSVP